MADVFISYKREDVDKVQLLVRALHADGVSVWWDQLIQPDTPSEETIERELAEAKAVVVCWSSVSVASEKVKAEARRASEGGRLLQTFLDDSQPPPFFGERRGVNLRGWDGSGANKNYQSLLEGVRAVMAGRKPTIAVGYIPKRSPPVPLIVIAGVIVANITAVVAIIIAGASYLQTLNGPGVSQSATQNPRVTLDRIFTPSSGDRPILGSTISYLESIVGPAFSSHEHARGFQQNNYDVGGCNVVVYWRQSEIFALGISGWSEHCNFDILRATMMGDDDLPINASIGEIHAAVQESTYSQYFSKDCSTYCGNSYDPGFWYEARAPNTLHMMTLQVRFYPSFSTYEQYGDWLQELDVCQPWQADRWFGDLLQAFDRDDPDTVMFGRRLPSPMGSEQSCPQ
jgi:hypothetical protein